MTKEALLSHILDAHPYPICFADCEHIIRYLNKAARERYCVEWGLGELVGKSLFDCHKEERSNKMTKMALEHFQNGGGEIPLPVNKREQKVRITPVHDEKGELIGYFERFESNIPDEKGKILHDKFLGM